MTQFARAILLTIDSYGPLCPQQLDTLLPPWTRASFDDPAALRSTLLETLCTLESESMVGSYPREEEDSSWSPLGDLYEDRIYHLPLRE